MQKQRKIQIEKESDKKLVNDVLMKERALDAIDKEEKKKKIAEFYENRKYLDYVRHQKKEADIWMDKIAQDEADREYEKEQAKWMKEEAARIELMKEVYRDRANAVMSKSNVKNEEKINILREREILENHIKEYN